MYARITSGTYQGSTPKRINVRTLKFRPPAKNAVRILSIRVNLAQRGVLTVRVEVESTRMADGVLG